MSYLIKNQVFFDNSWHEMNDFQYGKAYYPVEVSEKLSEELDSGELKFYTNHEILYPQMTKFSVEIDTETGKSRTFYFYGTDTYEKLNETLYKHRVQLVETTKDLEGVILDGLGFAQPEDNSLRMTLYDITQRLLACTPFRRIGQAPKYTLISEEEAPEIIAILKAQTVEEKLLPEFFWSSQTTLKEALCDIGAYCNLYPRLTLNSETNEYTVITFDEVNKIKDFLDGIGYVAEMRSQDDSQYCSELETNAQNVISKSKDLNTIVYPSPTGWITPRTDEVRRTSDNIEIELPLNINKITKVLFFPSEKYRYGTYNVYFSGSGGGSFITNDLYADSIIDNSGNVIESFDITYWVVEKNEFDTLKAVTERDYTEGKNQSNCLYYQRGNNKIDFGNNIKKWLGFETTNAQALLDSLLKSLNLSEGNFVGLYYIVNDKKYYVGGPFPPEWTYADASKSTKTFNPLVGNTYLQSLFRIEYEPLNTSSKFRISKSLFVDKPFVQNYNQRAEINSAEALGRNMRGTVNRMGVPTENKMIIKPDLSEVPKIGDAYEKDGKTYIISQIDYDCFSMYQMAVNLTLSQDWNMLSQYVGIDRQFRWEQIYSKPVERNLFYHDYLVILPYTSGNSGESIYLSDITKAASVLQPDYAEKTEIHNCFLTVVGTRPLSVKTGVVLSVSSNAVGSSMLFTAKTQDNLSAGKTLQEDDAQYCIDAFYCNEDGTAGNMEIRLATDMIEGTVDPNKLPLFSYAVDTSGNVSGYNCYEGVVAEDTFYVDKNNSEQLNFVYELSWVSPCPYLVVGENLAMNNPLVKQWYENGKFRFIRLKKRLPQGTVKVTDYYINDESDEFDLETDAFFLLTKESANRVRLRITDGYLSDSNVIGWAITDENHSLYLASNDKTKTDLKIITSHEYHGKEWKI